MRLKYLTIICVALAVIAAAVAAILVSVKRAEEARAYKEAVAAQEAKAAAEKDKQQKATEAESEKRRTAEQNARAKADELAAAKLAKETAEIEERAAAENRKAKEAESLIAKANSEAVNVKAAAEAAKAKAARDEREKAVKLAAAETAKAQAEQAKLEAERIKAEKILAEAKILELRQIDFATMQQELNAWRLDLEEREAAIRPEKTIADLAWVGGDEDMEVGSNGTVRVKMKLPYLAENDRTLPRESRRLAKVERRMREATEERARAVKTSVVKPIEKLYVEAVRENRVIDAAYYRETLKTLYPDWTFSGEENGEKEKHE